MFMYIHITPTPARVYLGYIPLFVVALRALRIAGCQIAWQRFEVHLDAVRARTLPEPWPWIWVLNEDAADLLDSGFLGSLTQEK